MSKIKIAEIELSKTNDSEFILGLEMITLLQGSNSSEVFSTPAMRAMNCQWPYKIESKTICCDESGKMDYSVLRELVENNFNAFSVIQRDKAGKYVASYFVPPATGDNPYIRTLFWETNLGVRLDEFMRKN